MNKTVYNFIQRFNKRISEYQKLGVDKNILANKIKDLVPNSDYITKSGKLSKSNDLDYNEYLIDTLTKNMPKTINQAKKVAEKRLSDERNEIESASDFVGPKLPKYQFSEEAILEEIKAKYNVMAKIDDGSYNIFTSKPDDDRYDKIMNRYYEGLGLDMDPEIKQMVEQLERDFDSISNNTSYSSIYDWMKRSDYVYSVLGL